jgi:hypothetical protein
MWHNVIENEKIQLWENYLLPFPYELPTVLLCPMNYHFVLKNPFPQPKPLTQTVKVTMHCSSWGKMTIHCSLWEQSDNAL